MRGAVVAQQARRRGATKGKTPRGSPTEEQRSQRACCAKTLRAAGLLAVGCVGSVLTARCGDARTSPPCPRPKSLAAAPLIVFRQALSLRCVIEFALIYFQTHPTEVVDRINRIYRILHETRRIQSC